jgi:hypothetical protein
MILLWEAGSIFEGKSFVGHLPEFRHHVIYHPCELKYNFSFLLWVIL